ncbi:hypothetical protein BS47DRAFT_1481746 [Hydnum rufescens UP504]|uniref:Uncharacterized protein n=1 Tax=Hydnum rufescens UP504 TaxID=1448309 RepID=A0A9P6B9N7_9AGAM|nr:hypothetical protein BS47DRAFT_1481746 [Hydnum rufescens UP504]
MRIVFSSLEPAFSHQYIIESCSERYGNYTARTQAHFYDQAQQSPNAPRVARVYEVFDDGRSSTYLVMEFLSAPSFEVLINAAGSSPECESLRATAIFPRVDSIGPVGGGNIQHIFFNMEEAPIAFATSGALETYVNKALSSLPGKIKHCVTLTTEARLYCPSDVAFRNFLWDGKVVSFVDWQHVNLLPQSFASYYFHSTADKVVKAVASRISLQRSTKLKLIDAAARQGASRGGFRTTI